MIKGLHHIGIASKNIDKDILFFNNFGYKTKGNRIEDTKGGIYVQFMCAENQPDIEIVQNIEKNGPVTEHNIAKRKMFHSAYISDDIEADSNKFIEEQGAFFLVPITDVDNTESNIKRWCYLIFRNMMIIELVEIK